MRALEKAKQIAVQKKARVIFPESDNPNIAAAAEQLKAEGLAQIVGLAEPSQGQREAILSARGMKSAIAERMLTRPLIRAAAMVGAGEADVIVAGIDTPTKKVIEAAGLAIGLKKDSKTPSSCFLICLPDGREFIFADCALNVDPSAEELADIAHASAACARILLGRAEVALLSFSTGKSGDGSSVDKVQAVAKATGFTGPIQADAALSSAIAAKKNIAGGNANTLIFPNLDAGNIAYKLIQELANAKAFGPMLQGYRRPVCDLSRGASVEDIVASTVLTIALSQ